MRMGGPVGIGGGGIGTILIVLLISWLTGVNPLSLLDMSGGAPTSAPPEVPTGSGGDDPQSRFISVRLGDMEDTWTEVFAKAGQRYQPPVARAVQRDRAVGMRFGVGSHGSVLLPG